MARGMRRTAWVLRMAWRDSRRSRSRLLLAASCIMIGIAGLVATVSFRENARGSLDLQARALLGADLVVRSRGPFTEETQAILNTLPGRRSEQVSFTSMVYFPSTGGTRLVRVRALEGDFPYYGSLETDPPEAAVNFRSGSSALVDDSLMIQFGARVGDTIKLGEAIFTIAGRIKKIPGETAVQSFIGPRVYIPYKQLPETQLIKPGSRTNHRRFFEFRDEVDSDELKGRLQERIAQPIRIETVASRKETLGNALTNVARFLNLVGFVAVLLGALAVGSAMHVYIKQKIKTVGLLRCLGASQNTILFVYLTQAASVAFLGALAGAILGLVVQKVLPALLSDFLPAAVQVALNWRAIIEGASVGLITAVAFASVPLLSTRYVTPMVVLSSAGHSVGLDRRVLAAGGFSVLTLIAAFALAQTANWMQAAIFTGGLLGAVLMLGLTAYGIIKAARRVAAMGFGYIWRQGLANLHRPNNQTPVLMISLGLATFLIATIYLSQQMLLGQVSMAEQQSEGNFVLFDVQADQIGPIKDLLASLGLEPKHEAPIVSMRLSQLNGQPVHELRKESSRPGEDWALRREYRATYRNHLIGTETLQEGRWPPPNGSRAEPHPVSLERGIADSLGVKLGDKLVFDVQGVPVAARVASIREVEWRRLQPNFFLVFPLGVLEEAPQTQAVVTRVQTADVSARLQRTVVREFPNVSMIDLRFILGSLITLLDRVSLAIRFLGSFSVFAGIFVLLGAITTSRYHRLRDNLLLRTLGASKLQILKINAVEYLFLGLAASAAGLALSLLAAWGLGLYLFASSPVADWPKLLAALAIVTVLTVITGLAGSWGTFSRSPLELLRDD